jgi:hypothetical protein
MPMSYPGRLIRLGESDPRIVRALKTALNRALALARADDLRLDPGNPNFGPTTERAVRLFQARHVDAIGRPLKVDGEVGSITWAALFGVATVPTLTASADPLLARVLEVAAGEEAKGVREQPRNSNRGPEVDQYLKRAGVPTGLAWCCAFVYWCFDEAARALGRPNPMARTAGCLDHWNRALRQGAVRLGRHDAVADPSRVKPGMVFIMDFGGGAGHTGLVESVQGGFVTTIEGNTDASRTREGGGVYRLTRKIVEIEKGFIDYAGVGAPLAPRPVRGVRRARPNVAAAEAATASPGVASRRRSALASAAQPRAARKSRRATPLDAAVPPAGAVAPAPKPVVRRARRRPTTIGG